MNTSARTLASLVVGVSVVAGTLLAAAITTQTPVTAESVVAAQAPAAASAASVVPADRGLAADAVADAAGAVEAAGAARKAEAVARVRRAEAAEESESQSSRGGLVLTCEPHANARLVSNIIVNKDCPALNAAKEQAQREYAEQQATSAGEVAQENALRACRAQTGMTTAECQADAAAGNAS